MTKQYNMVIPEEKASKMCTFCRTEKPISEFWKNRTQKDGYNSGCIDCLRARNKERYDNLRRKVLDAYGGVCACCGEDRIEFLAIDHIFGNGNQERKASNWTNLYEYLNRHGLPDKDRYRVLCHNCNMSFGMYGYCPHNEKK